MTNAGGEMAVDTTDANSPVPSTERKLSLIEEKVKCVKALLFRGNSVERAAHSEQSNGGRGDVDGDESTVNGTSAEPLTPIGDPDNLALLAKLEEANRCVDRCFAGVNFKRNIGKCDNILSLSSIERPTRSDYKAVIAVH